MTAALCRLLCAFFLLATGTAPAAAGMLDTLLENLHRSEFAFGRTDTNAPFPPVAWIAVQDHGESDLNLQGQTLRFEDRSMTQMFITPLWIGKKDMIVAGEFASFQRVTFSQPAVARRDLTTLMPIFAWLRQTGPHQQFATFVAPEYLHGADYAGHEFAEWSGYAGAIGINWTSSSLAWAYGAVAEFSKDDGKLFPYVGCLWQPTPQWSIAGVLPWPSITYAPSRDFMFQGGLSPADATLASSGDGNLRASYTSWNLLFSAHRRVTRNFWLSASVGWAGLGNFAVQTDGESQSDYELRRDIVWSLQFSFRPPTSGPISTTR